MSQPGSGTTKGVFVAGPMLLPQEVQTTPACFYHSEALATGAHTLFVTVLSVRIRALQPGPEPTWLLPPFGACGPPKLSAFVLPPPEAGGENGARECRQQETP